MKHYLKLKKNQKTTRSKYLSDEHSMPLIIQRLEPRMMYDGAAVATIDQAVDLSDGVTNAEASAVLNAISDNDHANATQSLYDILGHEGILQEQDYSEYTEVVFIDSAVKDPHVLISGIDRNAAIEIIDLNSDGVEQMAQALEKYSNLSAIHVISHGNQAELQLGNTVLNDQNIGQYETKLSEIGKSLNSEGDILFYGCNVAEGEKGEDFVNKLKSFTEADIQASNNITGNTHLQGDWFLEQKTDHVNSIHTLISQNEWIYTLHTNSVGFDIIQNSEGESTLTYFYGSWHGGSINAEGALSLYILKENGNENNPNDYTVEAYGKGGTISDQTYIFQRGSGQTQGVTPHIILIDEENNGYTDTEIESSGFVRGQNYFWASDTELYSFRGVGGYGGSNTYSHQWAVIENIQPGKYVAFYDNDPSGATPASSLSDTWNPEDAIKNIVFSISSSGNLVIESELSLSEIALGNIVENIHSNTTTDSNLSGTLVSSDSNSDNLIFSIDGYLSSSFTVNEVTYDISKTGNYGTLYLESSTGKYHYEKIVAPIEGLNSGEQVSDVFTVSVSDGNFSSTRSLTINIAGTNDVPTVSQTLNNIFAREQESFNFILPENFFSDVDDNQLVISAIGLPLGLVFDNETKVISGIPDLGTEGNYNVILTATDPQNASISTSFVLSIEGAKLDPNKIVLDIKPPVKHSKDTPVSKIDAEEIPVESKNISEVMDSEFGFGIPYFLESSAVAAFEEVSSETAVNEDGNIQSDRVENSTSITNSNGDNAISPRVTSTEIYQNALNNNDTAQNISDIAKDIIYEMKSSQVSDFEIGEIAGDLLDRAISTSQPDETISSVAYNLHVGMPKNSVTHEIYINRLSSESRLTIEQMKSIIIKIKESGDISGALSLAEKFQLNSKEAGVEEAMKQIIIDLNLNTSERIAPKNNDINAEPSSSNVIQLNPQDAYNEKIMHEKYKLALLKKQILKDFA
ncbi:DUF4347 domain-containing protein [Cysteiniphilum sp. JM-1]|uniref:DUF4347 domain-containing protein n=1 Tax=Cysteiniphilum sp. JM-1 TaxID=2610891 RepID=UPI00124756DD|nr:DUF4347 domain-containing protein [Cysteiniphilum sp. JM-1]